ncbi:5,10-methylenetetrahydrofolate reductase [bacterium HR39]|nr:5,10-methylenetetrahydrofolate reductase [bacterium HR39]
MDLTGDLRRIVEGLRIERAPHRPFRVSVELFPPRTPEAKARFWPEVERLAGLRPHFFSVTCGAGGTGRDGTYPTVLEIRERTGLPVAAHLTCAAHGREEVDALARAYWEAGVRHIVALRGDPPKGSGPYVPRPDGYAYAADLVRGLRGIAPFEISVAGYPETHPEAPSRAFDIDNVRRKVEAGAVRVIGQYCFDTDTVLRYRDELVRAGVEVPFVPGIMPVHDFAKIRRFSEACRASIPDWLAELFTDLDPSLPVHGMVAAAVAAEQMSRLVAEGFDHLHLYALNRADLTLAACRLAGYRPPAAAATETSSGRSACAA